MNRILTILTSVLCAGLAHASSPASSVPSGKSLIIPAPNGTFNTWVPNADMAAKLSPAVMELYGPVEAPTWRTRFTLTGIGRSGKVTSNWMAHQLERTDTTLHWTGANMGVQYLLREEGLRQNFLVAEREPGNGPLEVSITLNSPLCASVFGKDLLFHDVNGAFVHTYKGLTVWDACGTPLYAWYDLDASKGNIRIVVDESNAIYPITIDPVSTTTPDRQLTAISGGSFGKCVSSAGDLNGDGYSDVVVGAPETTNGGTAYVYYGSATGIGVTPNVTLKSGVTFTENFGLAVDGAGDVNGDGFEDLVIGASAWNNNVATGNEGAVFVYHGSATGIATMPNYILETNTTNSYMGSSVAGLGDINGDGFSDIIAGGYLGGSSNEGRAWVFLGSASGLSSTPRHMLERDQNSAQFGYSVNAAGDINGDGYNDVIVGAHKFVHTGTTLAPDGRVFIYHGSANALGAGLNPNPTLAFNTNGISTRTGWAVSSAGDVNGDGYSDIIISDWQDRIGSQTFEGVAFVYHGSAVGLNTTPVTTIEGGATNRFFGYRASTAGDVNGDGYADVLVGCINWTNGQTNEGATFLYLGSPTGINSSAFHRYEPNVNNAGMGEWVSTAGDVNGDGFSDMIIGAPGISGGRAFIYHGGTYNVSTTPAFTRSSGVANAELGRSVANAGDVNGDGYSDAIVGAPNASNGQAGEGLAYLHYGSATGLAPTPSVTLEVNVAGAAFGSSVASAGDVNGDGYADVVVGAPQSNGIGRAYIFHGGAGGLNPTPALTLSGTSGSLFGFSVFKAGDHNADGYSDVLVGAPGSDLVFVYPGSPTGLDPTPVIFNAPVPGGSFGASVATAGDVNGDGFSDILVGAPDLSNGQALEGAFYLYRGALLTLPTTPAFALESNAAGRRLGSSVAGIGDANGDGFYDVAVGAPFTSNPEAEEGMIYVYFGTAAPAVLTGPGILQSNLVGARMGFSLAEAGDVNGDGYADFITGAPGTSNGEAGEGRAYIYLGSPTGIVAANHITVEPNIASEAFGTAVAGGGDVDGDGYSDVICGSPNASPSLANEGTFRLFRGNNGQAYNRLTRQYMVDLTSPLATNSMDFDDRYYFGIGHRARSPMQRTTARLRWEVVHEGQPFSGTPITNSVNASATSATYTNLGLAGVEIKEIVTKIPSRYRNRWRVRVEYPMHKSFDGQRFSRWFYGSASGVGDIGVLPVELMSFSGTVRTEDNLLTWITASERNSDYFLVERSGDGNSFEPIGSISAATHSSTPIQYQFADGAAPEGLSYYRLRMVDSDGSEAFSNIIALTRDALTILVYPVPVEDVLFWSTVQEPIHRVIIHDALGRTVADGAAQGTQLSGPLLDRLATGTYSLQLLGEHDRVIARSRFIKR